MHNLLDSPQWTKDIITTGLLPTLLNKVTDINLQDFNENTFLHLSVIHSNKELAKALLKIKGIKTNISNYNGKTPVMLAEGIITNPSASPEKRATATEIKNLIIKSGK